MFLHRVQYYAFVEEKQKVHCLNTLFSKVRFNLHPALLPLFFSQVPILVIHRIPL